MVFVSREQSLVPPESRLVVEEDDGISPQSGELLTAHTISVTVPTSQIRPGDSVLVFPGETIPVDVSSNMNILIIRLIVCQCI